MKLALRMTHQREVILDELTKSTSHPTADDLYERVKKRLPRISLATVYRNLEVLSKAGMIQKLEMSGRQKRFDWDLQEHHHAFCVRCHRVDNIDLPLKNEVQLPPNQDRGYHITGYRVEFYGLCPECRQKEEPKTKGRKTMGCKKCGTTLTEKQREVLEALAKCSDACGSKDIAAATSLETKQVSCQITALKKKGYVASPARCKYEITAEGRNALG